MREAFKILQIILHWKRLGENMIIKHSISALVSAVLLSGAAAAVSYAADNNNSEPEEKASSDASTSSTTTTKPATEPTTLKKYHITFLDFDGKTMNVLEVEEGDPIDYSEVDVTKLHKHINEYTEQDFCSWNIKPDFADKDYTIHALSKTATIIKGKEPDKNRYFSTKGNVSLEGLEASIKMTVQTPQTDKDGKFITEESVVDISASCIAKPSALSDAFAKGDKATITVYPVGDQKPLCTFDIVCHRDLGDVNGDGNIDSTDASMVLTAYAEMAASKEYKVSDKMLKLSDVNMDGKLDARDASHILKYYAVSSTIGEAIDWEYFFDYDKILGSR